MSWLQGDCLKQAYAKAVTCFDFQYGCRGPEEIKKTAICLSDGSKLFRQLVTNQHTQFEVVLAACDKY